MTAFLRQAEDLIVALDAEVQSRVPGASLVSIEIEPLHEATDGPVRAEPRVLKASARACFIQGKLFHGETPVLKARAIYKKK